MKDITPETKIKFTIQQLICIAAFVVIGAIGYSDLRYEIKENRKDTQALVEQNKQTKSDIKTELELYSLKRQVLASEMLLVREWNRTNRIDEREIEPRLQSVLDGK